MYMFHVVVRDEDDDMFLASRVLSTAVVNHIPLHKVRGESEVLQIHEVDGDGVEKDKEN